ncbi:MAG TPA: ABC transporter ATP-binding protein, partial [Acidimicrobiales bacterium]|nr:ABC transporter ATP-binding protein [Acidimicrobiales bacterium]
RRIGYVPQEGSLFPHLSVAQNVAFGLRRPDRRCRRVGELIEMVGLGGLERRYPHQLSGGQQQRVALARALAIDPVLVLRDEPFSSLDARFRASVRLDVRRVLRDAGATALLVTHDQDEALSLSDRVAVIQAGCIGQHTAPEALYADPLSPELAGGVGEANFLAGELRDHSAATALGVLRLAHAPGPLVGVGAAGRGCDVAPEKAAHVAQVAHVAPFHAGFSAAVAPLVVLVRPEQVVLSPGAAGVEAGEAAGGADGEAAGGVGDHVGGEAAGPTGRVLDVEFYGHDAVIRLRADWDEKLVLTARVSEPGRLPAPGTPVALSVRGEVVAWHAPARSEQGGRGGPGGP